MFIFPAACKHPSYVNIVMRCLPQLHILDGTLFYSCLLRRSYICCLSGGHLNITEAFTSLEDHMKALQPDPADCTTPPLQPWLDGLVPSETDGKNTW